MGPAEWEVIAEAGRTMGVTAVAVIVAIHRGWLVPGRYHREEREEKKAWRSIALSVSTSAEHHATVAAAATAMMRPGGE